MGKVVSNVVRIARTIWRGALFGALGLALMLVLDVVLLDREPGAGNRER